ncbi:MAG: hypothetical protein QJR07_20850 [Acetobacteraceae bacterium]|nr:hypothetical protein [Acetobacteraceae bacterium]
MRIKARGQARVVTEHVINYEQPNVGVRAPTKIDDTVVVISGRVSEIKLGGNFNMEIEITAQELGRFIMAATEKSEALSALLKAAIANGDLARAGIRLR